MKILSDYHIHTYLCKHAEGMPRDYLKAAKMAELERIGFSDHCPAPEGYDAENRMNLEQFEIYREMIDELKMNNYGIEVLFGMEIDWVPGKMNEVEDFLGKVDYDYLIGSIHYVDGLPFDHPDYVDSWNTEEGILRVWNRYFELMKEFVEWGQFNIIGHFDLPKKFTMRPEKMEDIYPKIEEILYLAAEKDIMIELNTSGLRKPVKEVYPSLNILKLAYKNGVKVVFGSDAHKPEEVGSGFSEGLKLLRNAGYTEYNSILVDDIKSHII